MQRGFVFSSPDHNNVLCIKDSKDGFEWRPVDSTKVLNQAICLNDLTEAKNIYNRIMEKELANGLEIINIARLYKKFF